MNNFTRMIHLNNMYYMLDKILKLYEQFEKDQSIDTAEDILCNIDLFKAMVGERFCNFGYHVMIENKVTKFLNSLEKKGAAE